jgi:hypothetical protein
MKLSRLGLDHLSFWEEDSHLWDLVVLLSLSVSDTLGADLNDYITHIISIATYLLGLIIPILQLRKLSLTGRK